ncbi:hypothetical protein HYU40_04970 [Candidatus Woesearchaeota archaeon]|nr:hypothetical protein [Candidatus Woesearchaeota archaeon]
MMKTENSNSVELFWASGPGLFPISRNALHMAIGKAEMIAGDQHIWRDVK